MDNREEFIAASSYFLKAIKYMLFPVEGMECPKKPPEVKWEYVYHLAEIHLFSAVMWEFLQKSGEFPDSAVFTKWKRQYDIAVYADVAQQYAFDELKEACAARKLRILPFKGLDLKKLYPQPYWRQMGDLDVLYDRERYQDVQKMLISLGYEHRQGTEEYYHQEYFRAPVTHVEMHWALLPEYSNFVDYFKNPWDMAKLMGSEYVKAFPLTEDYIFMLVHAHKHFETAGCGVRTVTDFILFHRCYKEELDKEEVARRISIADSTPLKDASSQMSLHSFEEIMFDLSNKWFGADEPIIDEVGLYMLSSGAYGRSEHRWKIELEKYGRFRYLIYRVFPPYSKMLQIYPSLRKVRFLLPFYWLCRFVRVIFTRRRLIEKEMHFVFVQGDSKKKDKKKGKKKRNKKKAAKE